MVGYGRNRLSTAEQLWSSSRWSWEIKFKRPTRWGPLDPPGKAGPCRPTVHSRRCPSSQVMNNLLKGVRAGSLAKQCSSEQGCLWGGKQEHRQEHQPATLHTRARSGAASGGTDEKPTCGDFYPSPGFLSFLFNWQLCLPLVWAVWEGRRVELAVESRHLCWEPGVLLKRHSCVVASRCHLELIAMNGSGVKNSHVQMLMIWEYTGSALSCLAWDVLVKSRTWNYWIPWLADFFSGSHLKCPENIFGELGCPFRLAFGLPM